MTSRKRYDAAVIGGGFAGVTAARELARSGLKTVLLEARDRLGGKTWTSQFAGRRVEMGGMTVHWFQPHVWSEVMRYALPIVEAESIDTYVHVSRSGARRYAASEAAQRSAKLYDRFFAGLQGTFDRPYHPLFRGQAAVDIDQLSLRDRFIELNLPIDDEEWLAHTFADYGGRRLDEVSLTSLVRWFALAGWNYRSHWDTFARYQLANGTQGLIDAIVSDADVDVHLRSRVTDLAYDQNGVEIRTSRGQTIAADVVVLAMPVSLWPTINFVPGLPQLRLDAASEGFAVPYLAKIWVHARGVSEFVSVQWPPGSPITRMRTTTRLDDGVLLVCFSTRPDFDMENKDLIGDAVRSVLPDAEIVAITGHDWGHDEYSRGAHSYLKPGQLSKYLAALQQPLERIHWAGTDLANGWAGFIDGAIESGMTAARSARSALESRAAQARE